jgi:hypothetical protein
MSDIKTDVITNEAGDGPVDLTQGVKTDTIVSSTGAQAVDFSLTPTVLTVPIGGAFLAAAGVTSNSPGTVATDDFVFGALSLDGAGTRMLFDKSKGAFRAGTVTGTQWDDANRGAASMAWGQDTIASNTYATAWGELANAGGIRATAWGNDTVAGGENATAFGYETSAGGIESVAWGYFTSAAGVNSTAFGTGIDVTGNHSVGIGLGNNTAGDFTEAAADTFAIYGGIFKYVDTNEGLGKILTSDASGNATWQTSAPSWTTSIETTDPTPTTGDFEYLADTTGGAFTITLPVAPVLGMRIRVKDYARTFGTNTLTVAHNSEPIEGVTADLALNLDGDGTELVYSDGTRGWLVYTI